MQRHLLHHLKVQRPQVLLKSSMLREFTALADDGKQGLEWAGLPELLHRAGTELIGWGG